MATYYNPNTYDIGADQPIDSRFTKATNALRDAIPPAVRYEGLSVYVANPAGNGSIPGTLYILKGGISNLHWVSSSDLNSLWEVSGGAITNVGSTDVAITTKLKVPAIYPAANSITAFQFMKANGTTPVATVDTTNTRFGIGTAAPAESLDVVGSMQASGSVKLQRLAGGLYYPVMSYADTLGGTQSNNVSVGNFGGGAVLLHTNNSERVKIDLNGKVGIGTNAPSAMLHLVAGTTAQFTAPLKFTSGPLLTNPEAGAIEFLNDIFYATITGGSVRKQIAFAATTLAGYGITDGVSTSANQTLSATTTIAGSVADKLVLKHDYVTAPTAASLLKFTNQLDASLGYIGLEASTQALKLSSSAISPLIKLDNNTIVNGQLGVGNATTYLSKDVSNNLVFTDAVTGSKTLAQLVATSSPWTVTGNDIYNSNTQGVGIGTGGAVTAGSKLDVRGDIRTTGKLLSAVAGSDELTIESKSASGYDLNIYNVTNAVSRLYIDANGYVGINTNAHTDQFAVVTNTTGIYAASFVNSHNSGNGVYVSGGIGTGYAFVVANAGLSPKFTITGAGDIGIGTQAPLSKLQIMDVNKAVGASYTDYANTLIFTTDAFAADKGGSIALGGPISLAGSCAFAKIHGKKSNSTSGDADGYLAFEVSSNSGSPYTFERMRINANGGVGIGTTGTDGKKLAVAGTLGIGGTFATGQKYLTITHDQTNGIIYSDYNASGGLTPIIISPDSTAANGLIVTVAGDVAIGKASPSYMLDVAGTIRADSTMTATDFQLSSDERLKQNIKPIELGVDVEYKQFEFKRDPDILRYGVIAQELQKTHPELVHADPDGILSVSYIDLLVKEIASLKFRVKELEERS